MIKLRRIKPSFRTDFLDAATLIGGTNIANLLAFFGRLNATTMVNEAAQSLGWEEACHPDDATTCRKK